MLAWISLDLAFLAAIDIHLDLYGRGHRQQMPVMESAWPVTALYFGPAAS